MPPIAAPASRHKLLQRQIRRVVDADEEVCPTLAPLLDAVDAAYRQADDDRALLERSLELTSNELIEQNQRLRDELDERTRIQEQLRDELAHRRTAEESLRQSLVRLDGAQRIARLGYWTMSLVDGEVFWSDQTYRIFGYEPGAVTPSFKLFAEMVSEATIATIAGLIQTTDAHVTRDVLIPITLADGETRTVRASGEVVHDAEGTMVQISGVCVDVTEDEERRRELVRAKEHAETMLRLKSAFLSNMSHELRTPLTGILGYADLLCDEVAEDQRSFADAIVRSGTRLMDTLNAVLDLAQLESSSYAIDLQPTNVAAEAMQAVDGLREAAAAKGLQLDIEGTEEVWACTDLHALRRILDALVDNAVKFTDEGGAVVYVSAAPEGGVDLCVEDTGPGIPPELLPHVFDAFRQVSDGHGRQHEGNGLGLTIATRLTELMGGTLQVESELGRGSRFQVRLPAACPDAAPAVRTLADD